MNVCFHVIETLGKLPLTLALLGGRLHDVHSLGYQLGAFYRFVLFQAGYAAKIDFIMRHNYIVKTVRNKLDYDPGESGDAVEALFRFRETFMDELSATEANSQDERELVNDLICQVDMQFPSGPNQLF